MTYDYYSYAPVFESDPSYYKKSPPPPFYPPPYAMVVSAPYVGYPGTTFNPAYTTYYPYTTGPYALPRPQPRYAPQMEVPFYAYVPSIIYDTKQPLMQQQPVQCNLPCCMPQMYPQYHQQVVPDYGLPPNLCSVTAAPSWKQSYGMEYVWQNEFRYLFSYFSDTKWTLLPVLDEPTGHWKKHEDSAKVRFCCENCGHGWTSMKGRVHFWYVFNPFNRQGLVGLKLFGQMCNRCRITGKYESPMWYPEEVLKVLVNIYNQVGEAYFKFPAAPFHKDRRAGKPRTPHNSELCQACHDGVCSERR